MKGGINVKKAIIIIAVIVAVGCIVFFAVLRRSIKSPVITMMSGALIRILRSRCF